MKNSLWHCSRFRSTRCLWLFRELELLYPGELPELNLISLDETTLRTEKPESLLKVNRQGKVPTFQSDDGLVLFESAAICNYFCRRFDTEEKLLRRDANSMARHDMIAHYACGTADNVLATSSPIQRVLDDPRPGYQENVLAANEKAWHQLVAPTLEDFVKSRPPFFSASDVIFGFTIAACARKFPERLAAFPVLQSFHDKEIATRPAYQAAMEE
ncbi:Glutathione S-transferase [Seminavis robusta]|uniref:Glutathione S-transferase n=1 Tax=Seminavis robusta TaxID=568900 RepID=A0A9N8DY37_9STRA|nr:Glutathione S-transferase [Seminavis robusta]|eukprot:Sro333_g119640.1 Glutathione S-transferase (215) ;mRNA; f:60386-61030